MSGNEHLPTRASTESLLVENGEFLEFRDQPFIAISNLDEDFHHVMAALIRDGLKLRGLWLDNQRYRFDEPNVNYNILTVTDDDGTPDQVNCKVDLMFKIPVADSTTGKKHLIMGYAHAMILSDLMSSSGLVYEIIVEIDKSTIYAIFETSSGTIK